MFIAAGLVSPSTGEWINKLVSFNRMLFISEKEHTTDTCDNLGEHKIHSAKGKKSDTKEYTQLCSNYRKL